MSNQVFSPWASSPGTGQEDCPTDRMALTHAWGSNIANPAAAWPTTEQADMVGEERREQERRTSEDKSEKEKCMMVCKECGDMAPNVRRCLREKHDHVKVPCAHNQCTTLWVKNFPPNMTQCILVNWLKEAGCDADADFIYIPRHWVKDETKDFGFINVRDHVQIANVTEMLYAKNDQLQPGDKKLTWNWADKQGLAANIIYLRNSPVASKQDASPIILESGKAVPLGEWQAGVDRAEADSAGAASFEPGGECSEWEVSAEELKTQNECAWEVTAETHKKLFEVKNTFLHGVCDFCVKWAPWKRVEGSVLQFSRKAKVAHSERKSSKATKGDSWI